MALTAKQQRFVDEYLIDLNATQAAIRAGYSSASAYQQGSRMLSNAKVRAYIDERLAEKDAKLIAKQDEILEFLTNVMRGQVDEQFALGLGGGEQKLVRKELDGKDRIKAAELLGKRYGLWVDNTNLTGDIGVTIIDDIGGEPDETG